MKVEMWKKPEEIEERRPRLNNRFILAPLLFLATLTPVFAVDDVLKGSIIISMTLLFIAGMVFIRYGNRTQ